MYRVLDAIEPNVFNIIYLHKFSIFIQGSFIDNRMGKILLRGGGGGGAE